MKTNEILNRYPLKALKEKDDWYVDKDHNGQEISTSNVVDRDVFKIFLLQKFYLTCTPNMSILWTWTCQRYNADKLYLLLSQVAPV